MSQLGPVYVVVENSLERRAIGAMLGQAGFECRPYLNARGFLEDTAFLAPGCVLLDVSAGPEVIGALGAGLSRFPVVVIAAGASVPIAVQTMKLGAQDFLEKPIEIDALVAALHRAFSALDEQVRAQDQIAAARARLDALCPRERDVLYGLARGQSNKALAFALGIGVRTVETYRSSMLNRLGVKTLSAALLLFFQAELGGFDLSEISIPKREDSLHRG